MTEKIMNLHGLKCPLPALRVRKMLSGLKAGDLIVAECTDPLAAIDIPAFCSETGHVLVETQPAEFGHRFLVSRRPARSVSP